MHQAIYDIFSGDYAGGRAATDGKRQGLGVAFEQSGAIYAGSFDNDLPHGRGTRVEEGRLFQGVFEHGRFVEGRVITDTKVISGRWLQDTQGRPVTDPSIEYDILFNPFNDQEHVFYHGRVKGEVSHGLGTLWKGPERSASVFKNGAPIFGYIVSSETEEVYMGQMNEKGKHGFGVYDLGKGGPLRVVSNEEEVYISPTSATPDIAMDINQHATILKWLAQPTKYKDNICSLLRKIRNSRDKILARPFPRLPTMLEVREDGNLSVGEIYVGDKTAEGVFHGLGTFLDAKGNIYHGSWRNGQRHGRGTQIYLNSGAMEKFEGLWYHNHWRQGSWTLSRLGPTIQALAFHQDRMPDGQCTLTWPNSKKVVRAVFCEGKVKTGDVHITTGEWEFRGSIYAVEGSKYAAESILPREGITHYFVGDSVYEGGFTTRGERHSFGNPATLLSATGDIMFTGCYQSGKEVRGERFSRLPQDAVFVSEEMTNIRESTATQEDLNTLVRLRQKSIDVARYWKERINDPTFQGDWQKITHDAKKGKKKIAPGHLPVVAYVEPGHEHVVVHVLTEKDANIMQCTVHCHRLNETDKTLLHTIVKSTGGTFLFAGLRNQRRYDFDIHIIFYADGELRSYLHRGAVRATPPGGRNRITTPKPWDFVDLMEEKHPVRANVTVVKSILCLQIHIGATKMRELKYFNVQCGDRVVQTRDTVIDFAGLAPGHYPVTFEVLFNNGTHYPRNPSRTLLRVTIPTPSRSISRRTKDAYVLKWDSLPCKPFKSWAADSDYPWSSQ